MAGSPPRLDSITPTRGKPGDVMILSGRNFGNPRETAEVRISGISPTSQDYTEWTDTRISVRIPDEATSGIVYVLTKSGSSGGLLFINQSDIPQPATGASRPGDPYIVNKDNPIQPSAARVGDEITIYGMNFGLEKGSSEVYFTWSGLQNAASGSLDLSNLLPARDYNLDYISWSDREIRLRVPDGAASGNVLVKSDKGTSNAAYFVVNRGAGSKTYLSPRKYSVQYGMNVSVAAAAADNTLYLWMPRILPTPEQRTIEQVSQDPPSMLDATAASLYSFTNLQKGGKYRVTMSWMFDRYAVATQVSPGDVPPYATASELYTQFTAPDRLVPSASPDVVKAAAIAVGGEKNPWLKARRVYDWLLSQVSYTPTPEKPLPRCARRRETLSSIRPCTARSCGPPVFPLAWCRGTWWGTPASPRGATSGTSSTWRPSGGSPWTRPSRTRRPSFPRRRPRTSTRGPTISAISTTSTSPSRRGSWR